MNAHPARRRSFASRFSSFTAIVVLWVAVMILGLEPQQDVLSLSKALLLCAALGLIAFGISRFTIAFISRPLALLEAGIQSVRSGKLEPIPVNCTGDEIEFLGDSFNEMITALVDSRNEIRHQQEVLEDRIRQRTEELEMALQRALASSQAKSEFLANVSHELRTPMNGIIGTIGGVLDSRLSTKQRDQLETGLRCAYSLLNIVNDILDLSKIESGKMLLDKVPFDVRRLLDDCMDNYRATANEKGILLNCAVDPHVPSHLVGDPSRIRQVINNVLSNAIKFTEFGSVRIQVSGDAIEEKCFELRVETTDTGTGISSDKVPFLFDRFTQADSGTTRQFGRTGLGLAISRQLIEMHGGRIDVESTVGRGSTFTVRLLCESVSQFDESRAPAPSDADTQPIRILVVEDNLVNQKVVVAVLRKHGYEPAVANNGREALAQLREKDAGFYAAVLIDVQMPVLDGLQATRAIRQEQKWANLPIIAMTAHALNGDRDRCLRAGMNAYISKPVNPAHLLTTIRRYVDPDLGRERMLSKWSASTEILPAANSMGTDAELVEGMVQLFLQLAPERLHRLSIAADGGDTATLTEEAQKIATAAQRIAASEVSDCTREITDAAAIGDYHRVQEQLGRLSDQIAILQQNVRLDRDCQAQKS